MRRVRRECHFEHSSSLRLFYVSYEVIGTGRNDCHCAYATFTKGGRVPVKFTFDLAKLQGRFQSSSGRPIKQPSIPFNEA
jgi:hypothetical protein